ncbi:MAG: hypothetical protein JWQ20_377 [Conexibacter sp.]|nr:hypothetical protein [Conexibacter sp.]
MDLDSWIDSSVVRTHHRRECPTDPEAVWASAASVRLKECRVLGRLIRARIPGLSPNLTFAEMFRGDPFNVLEEGPAHLLSGLCGRIWTVRRDFAVLADPSEFRTWQTGGTARVLFASWAEPTDDGATLVSEVRVAAVDRRASLYVRGLGPFIAAFQSLVALEPMTIAVQRASTAARR